MTEFSTETNLYFTTVCGLRRLHNSDLGRILYKSITHLITMSRNFEGLKIDKWKKIVIMYHETRPHYPKPKKSILCLVRLIATQWGLVSSWGRGLYQ